MWANAVQLHLATIGRLALGVAHPALQRFVTRALFGRRRVARLKAGHAFQHIHWLAPQAR